MFLDTTSLFKKSRCASQSCSPGCVDSYSCEMFYILLHIISCIFWILYVLLWSPRTLTGWYLGGRSLVVLQKTIADRKSPSRRVNSQTGNCPWIIWSPSRIELKESTDYGCWNTSRCRYHERWYTYIFQTGRWAHTPEEQWPDGGSSVDVSSSYPLYQGPLQGCRAAAAPLKVSDGCTAQDDLQKKNIFK